jgi:hypothetical protein
VERHFVVAACLELVITHIALGKFDGLFNG